jgi:uncharacterized small protein (DUF1192 family)
MATAYRIESGDDPVRIELSARIAQLDRDFRLLSIGELGRRIDAIRHIARINGYEPACRLAGGMADALARDGRAAMVRPYLDGMRDAIACDPGNTQAGDALLASVSVRLVG